MAEKLKQIMTAVAVVAALLIAPVLLGGGAVYADENSGASQPAPTTTSSDLQNNVCSGVDKLSIEGAATNCDTVKAKDAGKIDGLISKIINIFSMVVGIIAVIMVIVGGLKFITSGGDSGKVTSARHTITYAIIGLVVVALAQVIVRFVLGKTV